MTWLGVSLATLGAQLVAGWAIYAVVSWLVVRLSPGGGARRRRRLGWVEAQAVLLRAAPWAAALLALALAALGNGSTDARQAIPAMTAPGAWSLPIAGALPTASACVLSFAGARYARGRLGSARRLVRLGGFLLALGILLQLMWTWADLLFRPGFRRALVAGSTDTSLLLATGMLALGCAAFIGLLAGLTGKALPSATFAILLYLAGAACLTVAIHRASVGPRPLPTQVFQAAPAPAPATVGCADS